MTERVSCPLCARVLVVDFDARERAQAKGDWDARSARVETQPGPPRASGSFDARGAGAAAGRFLPFCSEGCRALDLARWMDEEYRVSEPMLPGPTFTTGESDPE